MITNSWRPLFVASSLLLGAGCFSPTTTRLPTFAPGDVRIERQAAQTKDPYPVTDLGPDVGARPLEYQQPRSEAKLAKDRFFTWVRPRFAPMGDPFAPASMTNPPWMSSMGVPAAVPMASPYPAPMYAPAQAYPPSAVPWQAAPVPMRSPPVANMPAYPLY